MLYVTRTVVITGGLEAEGDIVVCRVRLLWGHPIC